MTVQDLLSTPAEFDHELTVKSIGPAFVLVLEQEAPIRLETMATTDSEFAVLCAWAHGNSKARDLLDVYFEGGHCFELAARESKHADRLSIGRPLTTLRVSP
jgi:hypothetical protein